MSFPAPIQLQPAAARAIYYVILPLALLVWLLPLLGIALTSLRSIEDISRGNVWAWPVDPQGLGNYLAVLRDTHLLQFLFNSLAITVPALAGTLALSCMAGFALARLEFRGNVVLLVMFVAGNLVPFQVLMIPVREMMVNVFAIYDTRFALILFHIAFQTGFATLFMRNFFRQLPDALFDAARIDGWGELRIFWAIAVPLVRPAIAGLAALIFTFVWNDYFWSLVLVHSDQVRPVTAGLQSLRGMFLSSWNLIAAASIIAALPPVLVFILLQRHFIAGLTAGATGD
ncbi:MAG: sugar transporter inner rane binding protein [Alphaproteobacteria bacterium]|jgi:multiple sugar transport system permease protein|nr:sugar transporter inner rane binding protein [Alphaproteobacteria bacterium]